MIKKFSNFNEDRAKNEGLTKFSKSTVRENDDDSITDDFLDYDDKVNVEILAHERPTGLANNQTNIKSTKTQIPTLDPTIKPNDLSIEHDKDYTPSEGPVNLNDNDIDDSTNESNIDMFGKVAKFPKNTKVSNAINFLENVKLSKNRIWYIMVEKQDNELQMIKYNMKKGVNLSIFVNELKKHYISKYENNSIIVSQLEKIKLGGDKDGTFSAIKNIPSIEFNGKKIITRITEDLIKLLSGKEK